MPFERQYTRLDAVRDLLDGIIRNMPDEHRKRGAYVHLYGTGVLASLLAIRRGMGRETAELAEIAGMLHDLLAYVDPAKDTDDHALPCADYAREAILDRLDCFTAEEKETILQGIRRHSDKGTTDTPFDEVIKDADAAHHALRNPMEDYFYFHPRMQKILSELTE